MDDPIGIGLELTIAIHKRQLAEHGGADGVRDIRLLESALARARQVFAYSEPPVEVATMAAAYAYGIARNHPFIDGNKRTAAVVCETFIELNGHELIADDATMYTAFLRMSAGEMKEDEFIDWLRANVRKSE
jgi:death on curing protein